MTRLALAAVLALALAGCIPLAIGFATTTVDVTACAGSAIRWGGCP